MSSIIKTCGLTKSEIELKLAPYFEKGLEAKIEENNLDARIDLNLSDSDERDLIVSYIANEFKDNLYSTIDLKLEDMVYQLLKRNKLVLSTAESLTGGLIASKLISVSGISENFFEGIVCYDAMSKIYRCNVSQHTIDRYGAISKQTAREMVRGLLIGKTTVAVSTTGNAGPTASEGKDVGLVYIAVGSGGDFLPVFEHHLNGTRNEIREQTANLALFYLIRFLQGNILLL